MKERKLMKSNCRNKILAKEEKMTRLKTKKENNIQKERKNEKTEKYTKMKRRRKKKKDFVTRTKRVFGCGDFLNESMRNPLRIDLTIQT